VRDVVSGAILRAEEAFETGDGRRVRVPWRAVAAGPVERTGRAEPVAARTLTVELGARGSAADDRARLRAAALASFCASPVREPVVRRLNERDGRRAFEVTVYATDAVFLPEIERAVRGGWAPPSRRYCGGA
jgi:hypothetical protein